MNIEKEELSHLKKEFLNYQMSVSIQFIRIISLILGILNLLLLIPDLAYTDSITAHTAIISVRVAFILAIAAFVVFIKKIQNFTVLSCLVTLMELIAVLIFLYVLSQYHKPDFMIQLVGVIVIVIVVFLTPNRWSHMLIVASVMGSSFLAFSYYFIPGLNQTYFLVGVIYLCVVIALCAVFSRHSLQHQLGEFIAKAELKRLNSMDTLTKLSNRLKLSEEADKWMDHYRTQGIPLCLILIDIDNMKKINDDYGHLIGDKVLVEISDLMSRQMRGSDVVSRWGGDEFILLLPDTKPDEAYLLCNRIRKLIAHQRFSKNTHVTCSIGVAAMQPDSTLDSLIAQADQSMYDAKKQGKNRVERKT
jgi:two-component system, cell cycle response regulator